MRYLAILLGLCFLPCLASADESVGKSTVDDETAKLLQDFRFDGVWKPKGAMLSGVLLPPPALEAITLTIRDGNYEVVVKGEDHSEKGSFTIDKSVTPMRMTITGSVGPNQGKTILAIFEIKNENAMRVCYDLSGSEFPKEFKAPKNSDLYLVGYRRQVANSTETSK